jgi:WS/DGAT/MGAT family acyltransferase
MEQLSALDVQFLHLEDATSTIAHVGSLIVVDPAKGSGTAITLEGLRAVVESRLHLVERFRQRLLTLPLGLGRPYWVDDPAFDIEFHLREIALPDPGDEEQLCEQVSRLHARPLDRSRALWELYLVHGLAGGRQAVYSKAHHAIIDGVSGAEVLATIMDITVEPRVVEPPDEYWQPPPLPPTSDLFVRGLVSMVKQPLDVARVLPGAIPHLADLPGASLVPGIRQISEIGEALVAVATSGSTERRAGRRTITTPPTPLNKPITAHRRFAVGSLPLAEAKLVKNAFGMTVNDVVMAMCATALRRWLLEHDGLPDVPIVAGVPVSVRGRNPLAVQGNCISIMLVELATQVRDPRERLDAVRQAIAEAKEQFDAVPATILQDLSAVIPTALAGLAARAIFQMVSIGAFPFNLFVSNVPGPQLPLYVAGARVEGIYPVSAISDLTGALNITLFSYAGQLDFGLIACREIVPDVTRIIGYLRDALAELVALAAEQVEQRG